MKKFLLWQIAVIVLVGAGFRLMHIYTDSTWGALALLTISLIFVLGSGAQKFGNAFTLSMVFGILGVFVAGVLSTFGTGAFWAFAVYLASVSVLLAFERKEIAEAIGGSVRQILCLGAICVLGSVFAIFNPEYAVVPAGYLLWLVLLRSRSPWRLSHQSAQH